MEHTDGSDGSDCSWRPIGGKLDARPKELVRGEIKENEEEALDMQMETDGSIAEN